MPRGMPGHAAALGHLLHHLLRAVEALEQLVDVARLVPEPAAMRARREPLMIFGVSALAGRHRADDRLDAVHLALVEVVERLAHLPHARAACPIIFFSEPGLAQLLHLAEEVLEREVLAGGELVRHLLGLAGVERLLGLLDEREDVAHVEDARRHAVGVEHLELGELLTGGRVQDRAAGDAGDRQRGTTAGVAVELGQHDAGEPDAVLERLRGGDGVLADHRVDDEEDLVGVERVADVRRPAA